MGFWGCVEYLAASGAVSFIVGRVLPKSWFRHDKFPYAIYRFEHGGKIFFTYFVGAGNLWTSYEDVFTGFFDGMQWNTGLQLGVNIKKAFNFFLRGGVGSYGSKIVPFISFDVNDNIFNI